MAHYRRNFRIVNNLNIISLLKEIDPQILNMIKVRIGRYIDNNFEQLVNYLMLSSMIWLVPKSRVYFNNDAYMVQAMSMCLEPKVGQCIVWTRFDK